MKAAVCRRFGAPLTIEEVTVAPPGPDQVQVRLAACAICHSDLSFADGAWGGDLPAVFGHEAAGVVTAIGENVTRVKTGDRVVVTLIRSCGTCPACQNGLPVVCDDRHFSDRASPLSDETGQPLLQGLRTGAFAEAVTVDASQVVTVPDDLPLDRAALLACGVITGFGAVTNTAGVEPGSAVVVIGTGGVGLNTVQGAAIAGAEPIIAIDISDDKLTTAQAFGATHAVNSRTGDARADVLAITGGRGADYVFITVGAKPAFDAAFGMMASGGAAVLVGMPPDGVMSEIEPGEIAARNQRILGSKMGMSRIDVDIPRLVSLYRDGRLKLDELISGRYRLDDINEAIAGTRSGMALRNVIVFDEPVSSGEES
ncbi:MAG TPA: Zn-dependent alcohol dehydrogenase [Afifellaceae bacterium]|nr:Zn-dependent alcohol dehydrogenase [Afifellaceae bacterium]